MRMQRAEIFVSPRLAESEREAVVGVERLRFEQARRGGDGVRDVVLVLPGHRCARLHRETRRIEGEIINRRACGRCGRHRWRNATRNQGARYRSGEHKAPYFAWSKQLHDTSALQR